MPCSWSFKCKLKFDGNFGDTPVVTCFIKSGSDCFKSAIKCHPNKDNE